MPVPALCPVPALGQVPALCQAPHTVLPWVALEQVPAALGNPGRASLSEQARKVPPKAVSRSLPETKRQTKREWTMAPVFWSLLSDQPCNPTGRTVWRPGRMNRLNRLLCGHKACIYSVFEQSRVARGRRGRDSDSQSPACESHSQCKRWSPREPQALRAHPEELVQKQTAGRDVICPELSPRPPRPGD